MNSLRLSRVSWGFISAVVAGAMIVGAAALIARADTPPTLTTGILNSSNATTTSAQIGSSVYDAVQVASSTASATPTGTINFNLYANNSCSGIPTTQSGVALVNGRATSSLTIVPASGLSYTAGYSGDASNTAVVSPCQPLTATASSTTLSTNLSNSSVLVGSSINDSATLGGATASAGGAVNYKVYTDNACSAGMQDAGTVNVNNASAPNSNSLIFNTPGTYYWQAVYSGDANNVAATSTCGSEVLTVSPTGIATPTISTSLSTTSATVLTGSTINDTATLSGATAGAGGSVAYKVYSNNICSALYQSAGTVAVTNGIVPNSSSVTFNTPGTYYWQAVYSGGANNAIATSSCTGEALTVSATAVPPVTGPSTISGTFYNDANGNDVKDAGEAGLSGWTVWLHMGTLKDGYNNPIVATATTDLSGHYSFANLAVGNYFVEEQEQNGWTQTSSDTKVALTSSSSGAVVDFANMTNGSGSNGNDGKGVHHNKGGEDDDNATSTSNGGGYQDGGSHHGDNATSTGNATSTDNGRHGLGGFIHNFINTHLFNGHDNGNHFGQLKNGNNGKPSGNDN